MFKVLKLKREQQAEKVRLASSHYVGEFIISIQMTSQMYNH
jgi:hypothetical protein